MKRNPKYTVDDFKPGEEIWVFKLREFYLKNRYLKPDSLELIHDIITKIENGLLVTDYGYYNPEHVWGKSRFQAWTRLQNYLEQWGALDGTS